MTLKTVPANRVAALTSFVTGLAGCATALAHAWPSPTMNQIALIAGSAGTFAGPLAHIVGSWLWDRTPTGQAVAAARYLPAPAGQATSRKRAVDPT